MTGVSAGVLTPDNAASTVCSVASSRSSGTAFQLVAACVASDCAPSVNEAYSAPTVSPRLREARPIEGYHGGIAELDTPIVPLTDLAVRKAESRESDYKLSDGRGLYLLVTAKGAKSWRLKYRFGGKEKLLTFGLYPEVKLGEARIKTDDARKALRDGLDPGAKGPPPAEPFEAVAREWHAFKAPHWSKHHATDVMDCLEREVFAKIGGKAIDAITVADVRAVLTPIEKRRAIETAHRTRQRIDSVFKYAIANGLTEKNPGAAVAGALKPKPPAKGQAAIVDLDEARVMLAAALAIPAQPVTRVAVLLLALTAVRSGELRSAEWREVDLDAALWTIPALRMKGTVGRKGGDPHLVPLAPAAVSALRSLEPLTGNGKLLFPSLRHATLPMSENAIGYLLNRAGYHGRQTAHGFRATFSSIMNERHPQDRAIIDLMLAHLPSGKASSAEEAYNRALHMPRRRELANEWAQLLTGET